MNDKERPHIPINISITSDDYAPEDSVWQEDCNQLYQQLKIVLDDGTLEPGRVEDRKHGQRGSFLEVFNTITAGIASVGGLSAIIGIAKLWLEHRKGSEVSLRFPDGSEINLSSASESDTERILELFEKKLAQPSQD